VADAALDPFLFVVVVVPVKVTNNIIQAIAILGRIRPSCAAAGGNRDMLLLF